MTFRDLDEFLVVKPIVLPIHGKTYEFPGEISARLQLQLWQMNERFQKARTQEFDPGEELLSDASEAEIRSAMFGEAEAQMVADDCTSTDIRTVFNTLIAYHLSGEDVAKTIWESAGEAPAPNRQERRAKAPATARGSRASSASPPKKKAPVSAGKKSSNAGS